MPTETLTPAHPEAPPAEAPSASVRTLDGPMTWADVCADPSLHDLPYKIELDRYGRLLMSPTKNRHGRRQVRISVELEKQLGGAAAVEIGIDTLEGTRVPDVVWMSEAYLATISEDDDVFTVAPEICIEVRSPSNVWAEMEERIQIYLAKGAQEVWICEVDGAMRYFGHEGERDKSKLAPDFPAQITL